MRRVELELVSGFRVVFTDRERALGQVGEWAEGGGHQISGGYLRSGGLRQVGVSPAGLCDA